MRTATPGRWAALATSIALLAGQATAAVIFDNGSFNSATPQVQRNYYGNFTMFEDFMLSAHANLSGLEWDGGEYQTAGTSSLASVRLTVYQGLPISGTLVYSGTQTAITKTYAGQFSGVGRYTYSITGLNLDLGAGTHYWFGLNGSFSTSLGGSWSNTVGTPATLQGLYQYSSLSNALDFRATENGAFRLLGTASAGVPLPGTLALALAGLVALGASGRGRRA